FRLILRDAPCCRTNGTVCARLSRFMCCRYSGRLGQQVGIDVGFQLGDLIDIALREGLVVALVLRKNVPAEILQGMLNESQLLPNYREFLVVADHKMTLTIPLVDSLGQPNCRHHFTLAAAKNVVQSCSRAEPGITGMTSNPYSFFTRRLETRLY